MSGLTFRSLVHFELNFVPVFMKDIAHSSLTPTLVDWSSFPCDCYYNNRKYDIAQISGLSLFLRVHAISSMLRFLGSWDSNH